MIAKMDKASADRYARCLEDIEVYRPDVANEVRSILNISTALAFAIQYDCVNSVTHIGRSYLYEAVRVATLVREAVVNNLYSIQNMNAHEIVREAMDSLTTT